MSNSRSSQSLYTSPSSNSAAELIGQWNSFQDVKYGHDIFLIYLGHHHGMEPESLSPVHLLSVINTIENDIQICFNKILQDENSFGNVYTWNRSRFGTIALSYTPTFFRMTIIPVYVLIELPSGFGGDRVWRGRATAPPPVGQIYLFLI